MAAILPGSDLAGGPCGEGVGELFGVKRLFRLVWPAPGTWNRQPTRHQARPGWAGLCFLWRPDCLQRRPPTQVSLAQGVTVRITPPVSKVIWWGFLAPGGCTWNLSTAPELYS